MSVIISATDFSDTANNATHYACSMALSYNATLTLLHSYFVPVSFADNPMPVMPISEGREIAEDQMNRLLGELRTMYPGLQVNSYITYGFVTDSLKEYIEEIKPWLVVIGNSTDAETNFWLGSNLLSELKQLQCTVIAIPPDIKFGSVKKICLACDFQEVQNEFPSADIINLVQQTGASLHVLNVDYNNREFGTSTPLTSTILHDALKSIQPEYHYIEDEHTEEGINKFVENNGIDWLMIMPHKHTFWQNIFGKSHTKQIVQKVHIPIVALHEKQE
jgi:nucleotide-binding universal stress UspA family protein